MLEEVIDVRALLSKDNEPIETNENIVLPNVEVDVGNLLGFCYQEIPQGVSLIQWHRDSFQNVINDVFSLPVTKSNNGYLAELPDPTTLIPREKPFPKVKSDTKWEKFRKEKGIQKKKRDTKIWDAETQTWKFRHGFKSIKNRDDLDWIIEDKPEQLREAGVEDPFLLKKQEKRERMSRQKKKEKSNQYRIMNKEHKSEVPGIMGITNKGRHEKTDVERAIKFAQKSTASIGYFDKKFDDEPKIKRKQQRQSVTGDFKTEKKTKYESSK